MLILLFEFRRKAKATQAFTLRTLPGILSEIGIYRQWIVVKEESFEKILSAASTATMMTKKSTIAQNQTCFLKHTKCHENLVTVVSGRFHALSCKVDFERQGDIPIVRPAYAAFGAITSEIPDSPIHNTKKKHCKGDHTDN